MSTTGVTYDTRTQQISGAWSSLTISLPMRPDSRTKMEMMSHAEAPRPTTYTARIVTQ